jgi:hypothetical protein
MPYPPCPECHKHKWATRAAADDFRREVLHCMECGFEVDKHVAMTARRIVRRDGGQDVRADALVAKAGE